MATVEELETKLTALIANLSPQARRQLATKIGRNLAQSQRQRIARQQNPDGSAFEPRKQQKLRKKQGRIKRKAMFAKLRTGRFLKVRQTAEGVEVGFSGNTASIAEVHQYGLTVKPTKRANYKAKYAQREVLGFSDEDLNMIENLVIEQLSFS